jgi:tetratricopeptide (TPR) repeat protein
MDASSSAGAHESDAGACIICLESEPPPLQSGCACRSYAGLAHASCRAQAAIATSDATLKNWHECSTCKQAFSGEMQRLLSSALSARVQALPEDDETRIYATELEVEVQLEDGQHAAAEVSLRRLHELRRKALGDEHETTLCAAAALSLALALQGKYEAAARLQRAVLEASKRVSGRESMLTMAVTGNLANSLSHQGKHADARRLLIEAVAMSTRMLGAEHLGTLNWQSLSAKNLTRMGNHAEAVDTARRVLDVHTRVLGAEHPVTLVSQRDLARSLRWLGRCQEAASLILGARVVLRGLVANQQHNGSVATVLSANAQRYTVRLDSGVALTLKRPSICVLCTGCAGQSDAARACGNCVAAWYCSVECQRAHWRTHKPACNAG